METLKSLYGYTQLYHLMFETRETHRKRNKTYTYVGQCVGLYSEATITMQRQEKKKEKD